MSEAQTIIKVDDDFTYIQDVQECSDVIQDCAYDRSNDIFRNFRKTDTFHEVAEIPMVLVDALKGMGMDIMNDEEALRKVLNDPEFKAFRTSLGRV